MVLLSFISGPRLAIKNGTKFVNETASLQTSAAKRRRENTNNVFHYRVTLFIVRLFMVLLSFISGPGV
jgi:hypothetical protein